VKKNLILVGLLLLGAVPAYPADLKESEAGFVFSATRLDKNIRPGYGGRLLHNYNPIWAFEMQGSFYPVNQALNVFTGTFDFKGTCRLEDRYKVNLFGLLGPGIFIADPGKGIPDGRNHYRFAVNAGGGFEVVPDPKIAIRADFTDLMVFHKGEGNHNLDFKLALMYRW
jgi:hypothetical protein